MRILTVLAIAAIGFAQQEATYEGQPAVELTNDQITVTVMETGATLASVLLNDDSGKMNPMWNPARMARELGQDRRGGVGGHFVCVDGFGPVSEEEKAAGLPGHGEARAQKMEIVEQGRTGATAMVSMRAELPVTREVFTRTVRIVDGENVVYVDSELENLLGFDRPIVWAEHATIGSPFLSPEVTVIDMPAARSQVRPIPKGRDRPHRLVSGKNFVWPQAPAVAGGLVDIRSVQPNPDSLDHTTNLMDENRELAYVTAINLEERLLLGYLFRREEYPWLQTWDNFPANLKMSRGIEFSTQPYDVPRREAISQGKMFGAPTYRWLPAKSKITTSFLFFYVRTPEGFKKVDDVRISNGKIIVTDSHAGKEITISASRGL